MTKFLILNLICKRLQRFTQLKQYNGDADVQTDGHASSFQIFNQVLENEEGIYVFAHAASCDVSNNPNVEELDESSLVHYHLPPTP